MRHETIDRRPETQDSEPEITLPYLRFMVYSLIPIVLCLASAARADLDMHILPGFDGYHKHDRWLPLRITLTSVDEDMTGEITVDIKDSATGNRQIYSIPVTPSRATRKIQHLYVLPESFRRNLQVKLVDDSGKTMLQKDASLVTIPPKDTLIVVAARSGSGLEFLTDMSNQDVPLAEKIDSEPARIHVSYSTAELLPDKWKGYDSVDTIVLGDISASALSAGQRQAITDWVSGGGRLIVSGGAHSQNLMGTFVEQLLPVKVNGTRVLDSISSLSPPFGGTQLVVALSQLTGGGKAVAVETDGLVIIAEREVGNGKVVFLAFDYLDPAFLDWEGKEEMWKTLIPQPESRINPRDSDIARLLSTSGSARLPSYKLVGIFLLLYVLCFGPLNYLILRKTGRRRLMWITMPVISAAFIIGALGFGYATRARAVIVNDFSIVDVYQDTGRIRISSYFGLLSPARSDYTIEFPELEGIFIDRIQSRNQSGDFRLVEEKTFQMEILDTDTMSSQLFHGESYADLDGDISANLVEDAEGIIQGEVINDLPFDLTDCYVFSDGRRFYIGVLARGAGTQVRLDQTYAGDISDVYTRNSSVETGKRPLINAIKPGLSRRLPTTGLIGWLDESALKTLAGMSMGEEYKYLGRMLVIVHLSTTHD